MEMVAAVGLQKAELADCLHPFGDDGEFKRSAQRQKLVVRGKTSASIAVSLALSPKTVEAYRSRLMAKLGIADLPTLSRQAVRYYSRCEICKK
jgi:DNA-binding NarL/FixJ family response regulator